MRYGPRARIQIPFRHIIKRNRHVGNLIPRRYPRSSRTLLARYTLSDRQTDYKVAGKMPIRCLLALLAFLFAFVVSAVPAPFDLAGPTLEVKVTRGSNTLPASQVPNLAP